MACQASNSLINKPYDDELCRVGLYHLLECLLINERPDCSTILAISKDLIDNASMVDSSVQVSRKENLAEIFSASNILGENGRQKIKIDMAASARFFQSFIPTLVVFKY